MKHEKIEFICRAIVCVASLVCTTILALKLQNAAVSWWYLPVILIWTF